MLYQQIIRISHGLQCNRNNKKQNREIKRDKKKKKTSERVFIYIVE